MKILTKVEELYPNNKLIGNLDEYDVTFTFRPSDKSELFKLFEVADSELLQLMGFDLWTIYEDEVEDINNGLSNYNYLTEHGVHYLFPQEWYDYIPSDLVVYDINGRKNEAINYNSGDVRYGCLPFGLVRKEFDGKIIFNRDLEL